VKSTNPKTTQQPDGKRNNVKMLRGIRNPLIILAGGILKRGR
jgi:hypothetical protein